ncbi:hypothetical protein BGZ93_008587 [Podila epicladia]|nr:hypothetical protein BGZ93_008587 [Podila epicladia]
MSSRYAFPEQAGTHPHQQHQQQQQQHYQGQNQYQQQHPSVSHFQDGHPVEPESSEWTQLRDQHPMKYSTASGSSFQSWTSTDPNSRTNSYNQQQQQYHHKQQLHQGQQSQHSQHSQHQGHYQQQSPRLPPRGQSIGASPRHRSNSNTSNISNTSNLPPNASHNYNHANNGYGYGHHQYGTHGSSHLSHMSNASHVSHISEQSSQPPIQPYRNHYQDRDHPSQDSDFSRVTSSATVRSDGGHSSLSSYSDRPDRPDRPDRSDQPNARHGLQDQTLRHHRPAPSDTSLSTHESSPRVSPRAQRRKGPTSDEHLPSLDDYEAMLQQMTSPGLNPSGARSSPRRQDREPRPDRSREPRKHRPKQRQEDIIVSEPIADLSRPMVVLPEEGPAPSNNSLETEQSEAERIRQRKLRRRSSLPSSLQAPSKLLPPKRRSSGHLSPKDVVHVQILPINENSSLSTAALPGSSEHTLLKPDDVLPPRSRKRFSWEDENVAAREDLLTVSPPNTRNIRNSGSSWQDGLSPVQESFREDPQMSSTRLQKSVSIEDFQHSTQPPSETAPKAAEQTAPPRSVTPTQSRSRSTTPVPGIRPPPGPAPSSPPLNRKVSPPSGGKRGVRSGSNASATLQPNFAHTRPRAGSAASMSSMSSMNSFTLDGILTPPPPSSPLPSLPPTAGPPLSSSPKIGLGISRTRKSSGASRELLPTPQLVLEDASLPTPSSSMTNSSEISHAITSSLPQTSTGESTPVARLKKRVSMLEKELANTEIELSSRIRDGSELQFKVEQLTIERDTLQSRMKLLEVHVNESAKRNDRERQRESIELDRVSLQLQHDQQLQEAVKQIQDEKEVLFEALMERQDRSRMEMSAQMETLRRQLADKEQEINRLKSAQLDQMDQEMSGSGFLNSPTHQTQEIARLQALQVTLEQELTSARNEIHRLQSLVADQKQSLSKDQRAREELEVKVEALMLMSDDNEQVKRDKTELEQLRQETIQLRADMAAQELRFVDLQRDLEASTSRSQQEEAQYRSLQDTVQRLSSKITRMEGQHAGELEQVQRDHDEVMERVVHEHAQALAEVSEQAQSESRSQQLQINERLEAQFAKETKELHARERVLRERLSEQSVRNDQLEAQLFLLEKAQAAHETEKETMARTNRSLERHLSMQHLQEQENVYKMEELERENAKLRAVLAELDMAAYQSRRQEEQDGEEVSRATMAAIYETQQRRWAEQTQLMERKMAKAEEEARVMMEQNMQLKVELEMAQSESSSSFDDGPRPRSP